MNPQGWLAMLLMAAAGLSLGDKRLTPAIRTYAFQAIVLGLLVAWKGWADGALPVLAFGAAILLVKGIATPLYLQWVSRRTRVGRELEPLLNIPLSLVAAGLCFIAAVTVAHRLVFDDADQRLLFVGGLTTLLMGLLTMATRRKAIAQALGLLTLENGAFLLSVALTGGLPLAVELAVLLDVLVLVVLLGILFHRIRDAFEHLDASAMRTLGE